MSGKVKHRRGKLQLPGKKKKSRHGHQVTTSPPKVATSIDQPAAATPEALATPAPNPAPAAVKNPGLTNELLRVGILFGAMLATLITLVLLLD
jgi:hypothetical protein